MKWSVIKLLLLCVVLFYLIVSIGRSYWGLQSANDEIVKAENTVNSLALEQSRLEGEMQLSEEDFVEEEARGSLNMVRPGESVVLLPTDIPRVVQAEKSERVEIERNWWRWMFGK